MSRTIKLLQNDTAVVFRDNGDTVIHEAFLSGANNDANLWVMFFSWLASDDANEDALVGPLIADLRRAFASRIERQDEKLMRFFNAHTQKEPNTEEKDDGSKQ